MRTRYGLFVLSVILFVGGISFIVAAERTRREARPVETPAEVRAAPPLATVKQLMNGMIQPAAESVWSSVSVTVSEQGTDEKQPRTDEEWAQVTTSAAVLVESATLLLQGNRNVGGEDWARYAREMATASTEAVKAAEARNVDEVFKVGETIYNACTNCHAQYLRQ
jgi:hypothetical protein